MSHLIQMIEAIPPFGRITILITVLLVWLGRKIRTEPWPLMPRHDSERERNKRREEIL